MNRLEISGLSSFNSLIPRGENKTTNKISVKGSRRKPVQFTSSSDTQKFGDVTEGLILFSSPPFFSFLVVEGFCLSFFSATHSLGKRNMTLSVEKNFPSRLVQKFPTFPTHARAIDPSRDVHTHRHTSLAVPF